MAQSSMSGHGDDDDDDDDDDDESGLEVTECFSC